jgi:hypothetical protein
MLRIVGARAGTQAIVEASVAIWQRVDSELAPIIGEAGVHALYTRSLHLQCIVRPEIKAALQAHPAHPPFLAVQLSLERREAAEALEASVALLDTFTTLLSGLIGEGLGSRLLNPVWADMRNDEPAQETMP